MIINPYKVLGVADNTSKDECKKAYRKLCAKYHPDNGGDPDKFEQVCKAWSQIEKGVPTVVNFKVKRGSLRHKSLFSFV